LLYINANSLLKYKKKKKSIMSHIQGEKKYYESYTRGKKVL